MSTPVVNNLYCVERNIVEVLFNTLNKFSLDNKIELFSTERHLTGWSYSKLPLAKDFIKLEIAHDCEEPFAYKTHPLVSIYKITCTEEFNKIFVKILEAEGIWWLSEWKEAEKVIAPTTKSTLRLPRKVISIIDTDASRFVCRTLFPDMVYTRNYINTTSYIKPKKLTFINSLPIARRTPEDQDVIVSHNKFLYIATENEEQFNIYANAFRKAAMWYQVLTLHYDGKLDDALVCIESIIIGNKRKIRTNDIDIISERVIKRIGTNNITKESPLVFCLTKEEWTGHLRNKVPRVRTEHGGDIHSPSFIDRQLRVTRWLTQDWMTMELPNLLIAILGPDVLSVENDTTRLIKEERIKFAVDGNEVLSKVLNDEILRWLDISATYEQFLLHAALFELQ